MLVGLSAGCRSLGLLVGGFAGVVPPLFCFEGAFVLLLVVVWMPVPLVPVFVLSPNNPACLWCCGSGVFFENSIASTSIFSFSKL